MDADLDARLRTHAFAYLKQIDRAGAGLVTREQLEAFTFEGRRIPLIAGSEVSTRSQVFRRP